MKIITPMTPKEFTKHLLAECADCYKTVEFATECSTDPDEAAPNDCESWWFARYLRIEGYESRCIYIDYAGGEDAYAIPLGNWVASYTDSDEDYRIVLHHVKQLFKTRFDLDPEKDRVFVEEVEL